MTDVPTSNQVILARGSPTTEQSTEPKRRSLEADVQHKTSEQKVDSLTLKWGTLKSWNINSERGIALLQRYREIGQAWSAVHQIDTPEQKEIICQLIDGCDGDIYLEWGSGGPVSKDKAKEYVRRYRRYGEKS